MSSRKAGGNLRGDGDEPPAGPPLLTAPHAAFDRQTAPRESFRTRFGALMAMIGVAMGLGNVWRFPYMIGAYGRGAFILVYLLVVIAFGVPCMMAEWTLGRMLRTGPMSAYRLAGVPFGGSIGAVLCLTILMAFSYYVVVVGWVAIYTAELAAGRVLFEEPARVFAVFQADAALQYGGVVLVVAACGAVVALGVRRGIERVSSWAMPLAVILLALLMGRALTLPGAWDGVRAYMLPDLASLSPKTFLAAVGQAFFTLSLGGTFFLVYGSYLDAGYDLPRNAFATVAADTGTSLMAALIVLPAAYVFRIEPSSGAPLVFVTLPSIFEHLPAGRLFALMFFVTLLIAGFLSSVAAYEVIVSAVREAMGWTRRAAVAATGIASAILVIPAVLSVKYVEWADLIFGSTMQPLGSLAAMIALGFFIGRARAMEEVNRGASHPVPGWWFGWIRYGAPILILGAVVYGWIG